MCHYSANSNRIHFLSIYENRIETLFIKLYSNRMDYGGIESEKKAE